MWDEQSSVQVPILEVSVPSTDPEEQQVVFKFPAQACLPSSSSGDVLTKLLAGSSLSPTGSVATYVLANVQMAPSFRKIEPKPSVEEVRSVYSDGNGNGEVRKVSGNRTYGSGRLLDINATRRGVKLCPQCSNKIGYRAKQCKFCCPAKQSRKGRKSRQMAVLQTVCDEDIHTVHLEHGSNEVDMVMVQNETEVSTSEEAVVDTHTVEVVGQEVFVPASVRHEEVVEEEVHDRRESKPLMSAQNVVVVDTAKKQANLRDLIRNLLVKQGEQSISLKEVKTETTAGNEDLAQEVKSDVDSKENPGSTDPAQECAQEVCTEVSYDANSVALFLGHLAQQNGKKLRTAHISTNGEGQVKAAGSARGRNRQASSESTPAKYRRIQPKCDADMIKVQVKTEPPDYDAEAEKDQATENRADATPRMLSTNPTRRGVMQCHKCRRLIGCRSKACKFCKSPLMEANVASYRKGSCLRQAVRLQLPVNLLTRIYSVRRLKGGPDHRCFVRCEIEESESNSGHQTTRYSCDYPLCVTEQELGEKVQNFLCEHAKLCRSQSTVSGAQIPQLKLEQLDELPLSEDVKAALKLLHEQCNAKQVPLVQLVSDKTLSVVDKLAVDQADALAAEVVSFVHVRFERCRAQGQWHHQVFCSGRPCAAWNPVFSTTGHKGQAAFAANFSKGSHCSHYGACLWAFASDERLSADFKPHLMARLKCGADNEQ